MSESGKPNVTPLMQRTDVIEKIIRRLAADSDNIAWGPHAFERSEERTIHMRDALEVLRTGYAVGPVTPGKNNGEWKVKMVKEMKGRQEIGVATIVINQKRLWIKTVEWELPK